MPDVALQPTDGIPTNDTTSLSTWGQISRNRLIVDSIFKDLKAGRTQTEIAKSLGITQSAVSKVVDKYAPRDDLAVMRARNLSLPMIDSLRRAAKNGEKQGRHGAAETILKAAGVIGAKESDGPKVLVQIGVRDSDVAISLASVSPAPTSLSPSLSDDMHRLSAEHSSD